MSLSPCIVYTISHDGFIINKFECDREFAMTDYHNRRTVKGRYLIANVGDKIPYVWAKKPLKDLERATSHSENSDPS